MRLIRCILKVLSMPRWTVCAKKPMTYLILRWSSKALTIFWPLLEVTAINLSTMPQYSNLAFIASAISFAAC